MVSELSGFFQMTANFPDDFKTVRIFPFFYCIVLYYSSRTLNTHSLAMSWEANTRFLGLSRETVSRASSGKFLRVKSCYPEIFGFLCLCTFGHGHKFLDFPIGKGPSALGDRNKQKYGHFVPRKSDLRRKDTFSPDLNVAPRYLSNHSNSRAR